MKTDAQVRQDVLAELKWEASVNAAKIASKRHAQADAQQIVVAVSGGNVTLSGQVPTCSERDMARNSAWSTAGVKSVVDNMTVCD